MKRLQIDGLEFANYDERSIEEVVNSGDRSIRDYEDF